MTKRNNKAAKPVMTLAEFEQALRERGFRVEDGIVYGIRLKTPAELEEQGDSTIH